MRADSRCFGEKNSLLFKEGEIAVQGQDMGFIKFGSRVDLFLPLDAQILVTLDQRSKVIWILLPD